MRYLLTFFAAFIYLTFIPIRRYGCIVFGIERSYWYLVDDFNLNSLTQLIAICWTFALGLSYVKILNKYQLNIYLIGVVIFTLPLIFEVYLQFIGYFDIVYSSKILLFYILYIGAIYLLKRQKKVI